MLNRRSGEEEVPNAVEFKLARFGDVVADELKAQVFQTLEHIGLTTGEMLSYQSSCSQACIKDKKQNQLF